MNLNEIKESLSKATPGVHVVGKPSPNGLQNIGVSGVMTAQAFTEGDANLYANAPQWIASLIEHYEECRDDALILDKQVKELQQTNAQIIRTADVIDARNQDLIRQVEEMKKTLEWYAEELPHKGSIATKALMDRGAKARQTLQSLKEDKT